MSRFAGAVALAGDMSHRSHSAVVRLAVGVTAGVLVQLVALYLILHWAEQRAAGVALYSLLAIVVMGTAILVSVLVNARLILRTARWPFALSLAACIAVALLAPVVLMALLALLS